MSDKLGQNKGTWTNSKGNNYAGTATGSTSHEKVKKSARGYYELSFTRHYLDITKRDEELRYDYAKGEISQALSIPKDMITLRKKSENQTLSSIDEVYYVKRGKESIGKVSIRTQRRLRKTDLIIVYQEKRFKPSEVTRKSTGQRKYTNKTNSALRATTRKSKNKKKRTF